MNAFTLNFDGLTKTFFATYYLHVQLNKKYVQFQSTSELFNVFFIYRYF